MTVATNSNLVVTEFTICGINFVNICDLWIGQVNQIRFFDLTTASVIRLVTFDPDDVISITGDEAKTLKEYLTSKASLGKVSS